MNYIPYLFPCIGLCGFCILPLYSDLCDLVVTSVGCNSYDGCQVLIWKMNVDWLVTKVISKASIEYYLLFLSEMYDFS